jgi:4-nitrophenyl phosphatase
MRGTPGEIKNQYRPFAGFIIDIEGVLIRGDTLIPPALKAIVVLQELEKEIIFLSNISDLTREEMAGKLRHHGFDILPNQVITSAYATALFLEESYPNKKNLFLVGTPSFKKELSDNGFIITEDSAEAEVVVVGLDYQLNYHKICAAAKAIKKGCMFVAANLAKVKLTSDGYVVGPGFTVKGLEYATNRQAQLAGKPSHFMFKQAIGHLGLPPSQVLTIGDKLEEDIFGGYSIGTSTCLVLSGATNKNEILSRCKDYRPDFILEDLSELLEY